MFVYTWRPFGWPTTPGVWLYHDHSVMDTYNTLRGAIGFIVTAHGNGPHGALGDIVVDGQEPGTPASPGSAANRTLRSFGSIRTWIIWLFGKDTQAAAAWAAKMRRWLRDKRRGVFRVLHSAAAHACRWELTAEEQRAYAAAYHYLRERMALMDYWGCRQRGLAIGSGITEAACKTLFTQRLKQSGMKWSLGNWTRH